MNEHLRNLILPAAAVLISFVLFVLVLRERADRSSVPDEARGPAGGSVETPVFQYEDSWIEYFDTLPARVNRFFEGGNPFFADYEEPEPATVPEEEEEEPEEEEPPPPPPPRAVELYYGGFFRDSQGRHQAYVYKDGRLILATEGTGIVEDWTVSEFDSLRLLLEDGNGGTVELEFREMFVLEIPVHNNDG